MKEIDNIKPGRRAAFVGRGEGGTGNEFLRRKTLLERPLLKSREAIRPRERDYYSRNRERLLARRREHRNRPEVRERLRVWYREYRRRPEVRERLREYRQRPDQKRKAAEYRRRNRERRRLREQERRKRPEVRKALREYHRAYAQRPDVKLKRGGYSEKNKDKFRAYHRAYVRAYRKRPYVMERMRRRRRSARFKKKRKAYLQRYFMRSEARMRRIEASREYRRRRRRALAARRAVLRSTPEAKTMHRKYVRRPDVRAMICLNARNDWKYHRRYSMEHRDELNALRKASRSRPEARARERIYQRRHRERYAECEQFIEELLSRNQTQRTDVILALGVRKFRPARKMLVRLLKDSERHDRMAILSALGSIGDPRSTQAVADAVSSAEQSNDAGLLGEALMALGRLRNKDALRVVKRFLTNSDGQIRECAERACWLSFDPLIDENKTVPTFDQRPLPSSLAKYLERI